MQLRHLVTASLCIGIIHAFGEFDRLGRRLMMRWLIDSRWRIVGVSQPLRDYLIHANCGLHANNTFAINNGIDVQCVVKHALNRDEARKVLKLPSKGMVFGTVGRSVKGKRQLELIQAFHQFAIMRPNVYLVIIGDGERHAELIAYVTAHQLQDKVYFAGYVPQAVNYLRALDVFVFPSEAEGFGIALLEAMALSLPAIVNQVEPLQSIIADVGLAVDSLDILSMAKAMEHYEQMPPTLLIQKGIAHYERVSARYDIQQYRSAYRDLVEKHFSYKASC
jgi:glycosyltransferase involved in cell wall biosynthesis